PGSFDKNCTVTEAGVVNVTFTNDPTIGKFFYQNRYDRTMECFVYPGQMSYGNSFSNQNSKQPYNLEVPKQDINYFFLAIIAPQSNRPPSPPTIAGPIEGVTGTSYTYTASDSVDPDGDQIRYGFDWNNDSEVDYWTSLMNSGSSGVGSYIWITIGSQPFQVLAEDSNGHKSSWSPWRQQINIPLPTVTLVASETSVPYSGTSNLMWTSSDTDSCVGTNFSTGDALNQASPGVSTGALTSDQTYTITCTGPVRIQGMITVIPQAVSSVTVSVLSPFPTTPTDFIPPGTTCSSIPSIKLTWSAVSGATGYRIYRSVNQTGTYSEITSGGISGTTFTDSAGLVSEGTYWYKATAYNDYGESEPTLPISTTASAPCAPLPSVSVTAVPQNSTVIPFTSYVTATVTLSPVAMGDGVIGNILSAFTKVVQGATSINYDFDCGNGSPHTPFSSTNLSESVNCSYSSYGIYNLTVQVTSPGGADSRTIIITATEPPPTPPCVSDGSCVVDPNNPGLYNCIGPDSTILAGQSKIYYEKSRVASDAVCESDVRTCDGVTGTLSSSYNPPYSSPSCVVSPVFNPF
ncbi:MAG: fibronectin type III domain-containing protein, partial [Parcubacteria group bacterium]|nr:fibronectin type III domain-containing protein [Parcubacteria group bacterium]